MSLWHTKLGVHTHFACPEGLLPQQRVLISQHKPDLSSLAQHSQFMQRKELAQTPWPRSERILRQLINFYCSFVNCKLPFIS